MNNTKILFVIIITLVVGILTYDIKEYYSNKSFDNSNIIAYNQPYDILDKSITFIKVKEFDPYNKALDKISAGGGGGGGGGGGCGGSADRSYDSGDIGDTEKTLQNMETNITDIKFKIKTLTDKKKTIEDELITVSGHIATNEQILLNNPHNKTDKAQYKEYDDKHRPKYQEFIDIQEDLDLQVRTIEEEINVLNTGLIKKESLYTLESKLDKENKMKALEESEDAFSSAKIGTEEYNDLKLNFIKHLLDIPKLLDENIIFYNTMSTFANTFNNSSQIPKSFNSTTLINSENWINIKTNNDIQAVKLNITTHQQLSFRLLRDMIKNILIRITDPSVHQETYNTLTKLMTIMNTDIIKPSKLDTSGKAKFITLKTIQELFKLYKIGDLQEYSMHPNMINYVSVLCIQFIEKLNTKIPQIQQKSHFANYDTQSIEESIPRFSSNLITV